MMNTCTAQNSRKHTSSIQLIPRIGRSASSVRALAVIASINWKIANPPIQVWIPNQPQATSARSREGMCAPWIPKLARASTGNGTPYFVPGWPLRTIGISTITLPSSTVSTACHQLIPFPIMLAASM